MNDATKRVIIERICDIFISLVPDMTFRKMYGGTVFELQENDPKSRVGGIYTYTHYVSVEFSKGVMLNDPNQVLEGAGKFRRHVKLHTFDEIQKKGCNGLLRESISQFELSS